MRRAAFLFSLCVTGVDAFAGQQCAIEDVESYKSKPSENGQAEVSGVKISKGTRYETGDSEDGWVSVDVVGSAVWARAWAFAFSCAPKAGADTPKAAASPALSPVALVAKAKSSVTNDFKDPESAKFRNLAIFRTKTGKTGNFVCGEVNAKNSYGAYVGYRGFVYADGLVALDDSEGIYPILSKSICYEKVRDVK